VATQSDQLGSDVTGCGVDVGSSELTKALGLEMTHEGPRGVLGPNRCKRSAIYVVDGKVEVVNVSEAPNDPAGDSDPSKSCIDAMLMCIEDL
jgi:peroxiredoxin